jgi:hypothetical protein
VRCQTGSMNTTDLAASIEQLVRTHISEIHRSTAAALERAFASIGAAAQPKQKQKQKQRTPRTKGDRRDPAKVAELAERLHAAVCATPGETMGVLAERIGATVRELNRPMNNLRRAGKLRSAGVRNRTRYFPALSRAANSRNG